MKIFEIPGQMKIRGGEPLSGLKSLSKTFVDASI